MDNKSIQKTVCFTGHRDIPADKLNFTRHELRREIEEAIADGYTLFISGFAEGTDLMAAQLVLELQKQHPNIGLEAAIPYRKRLLNLFDNPETKPILLACSIIGVHSEEYHRECFLVRNRYMVSMSARVIALYDGREKGGTVQTMRFAHVQEREIREIRY